MTENKHTQYFGSISPMIGDLVVSVALGATQSQSSFCEIVPPACVSVLQVLWLRHPEERASLRGERLTGMVCAFNCTTRHFNKSDAADPTVSSVYGPLSLKVFKIGCSVGKVILRRTTCLLLTGMWSSPYGGAGTWRNPCWISSRAATEVRAQSSLKLCQAEPAPVLCP